MINDSALTVLNKKTDTALKAYNLKMNINSRVGIDAVLRPQSFNQISRGLKMVKLKEAVVLTQEYANEIIGELNVVNEELQTSNEELETTQEKLQIRNEEVIIALDYAEAIIKTVRGPLLILDGNFRVRSANESFYKFFKVTPQETENMSLFELGNKQWEIPKLRKLLEKILPTNIITTDYEVEHVFESIGQKTMLLNARTLVQGPNKTPLILIAIEDITDRKDIENQKDLFIGIASHELKTPITTIKGYAQILEKRLEQKGDNKDTYLIQNINTQTDRLTNLINDLLNANKIQAGKLVLEKKKFDLNAMVSKIVLDFKYVTETHQIIKQEEVSLYTLGDQSRIEQVLINLLTNAIKYSPKIDEQNSLSVKKKVIVLVKNDNKNIVVSIQDFGFGIEKRDQLKIFERFYRTGDKEEMNVAGFGLGLYIAAEIIKGHHGKIWVESIKGKGSTFYFTLPIAKGRGE